MLEQLNIKALDVWVSQNNGEDKAYNLDKKVAFKNEVFDLVKKSQEITQLSSVSLKLESELILLIKSGPPEDTLGIILELKKSKSSGEISRKLIQEWMNYDGLTKSILRLSIGESSNQIQTKIRNFQKILFTIPDIFNLCWQQFLKFLLDQILLSILSLSNGLKSEDTEIKIRTEVNANLIERTFLRYYNEDKHFIPIAANEGQSKKDYLFDKNSFFEFFKTLFQVTKTEFITRRILTKIFLNIGSASIIFKISKLIFLIESQEASTVLLQPKYDYLELNSIWKHCLLFSIPFKVVTNNTKFWTNWANFVYDDSEKGTTVWDNTIKNWIDLSSNSHFEVALMTSASYALIALTKKIKKRESSELIKNSTIKIFQNVSNCLDSLTEEKRAAGMALAQIIADLNLHINSSSTSTAANNPPDIKKLEFNSKSPLFVELLKFYKSEDYYECSKPKIIPESLKISTTHQQMQILDSDDDDDDDDNNKNNDDDFDDDEILQEKPFDERIQHNSKAKRLEFFSEVYEVLLEGSGGQNKNESETEALKQYALLKIPILLIKGAKIDSNMAQYLVRFLIEIEKGNLYEESIIFALLELSRFLPATTFETIAFGTFNKTHYTIGHRLVILNRMMEVIQLLSRQKCHTCYKLPKEISTICPDFIKIYYFPRAKVTLCGSCSCKESSKKLLNKSKDENKEQNDQEKNLTWREIVDMRIASKTRYFFKSSKNKTTTTTLIVKDNFIDKYFPVIWAALTNQLLSRIDELSQDYQKGFFNIFLCQMFRALGLILMGNVSNSPNIVQIISQVGEITSLFCDHPDENVRKSVTSLLAIAVTSTEGKMFALESLSKGSGIVEKLNSNIKTELNLDNKIMTQQILDYISASSLNNLGIDSMNNNYLEA